MNKETNHLTIKEGRREVQLQAYDILFIKSAGDYVRLITPARKFITHSAIKGMEGIINSTVFARVHRSYIVNLSKVTRFAGNTLTIDKMVIPISRRYKAMVQQRITG